MSHTLEITSVAFTTSTPSQARTGLLGWVTCVLNDALLLDGITLRRTAAGRLTLSYPARRDRAGNQNHVIRPLDDDARQHLEREIFKALKCDLEETVP